MTVSFRATGTRRAGRAILTPCVCTIRLTPEQSAAVEWLLGERLTGKAARLVVMLDGPEAVRDVIRPRQKLPLRPAARALRPDGESRR
jgi:hypothetical protein